MTDRLTSLLAERPWLLADGATGTAIGTPEDIGAFAAARTR